MAEAAGWHWLREIAVGQFGLFTAAQAGQQGIAGYELARRAKKGELLRVRHGVYRCPGTAPACPFEAWAAQWLALRPHDDIAARRAEPDGMISHQSAAVLRGLGAFDTQVLYLTTLTRIRPKATGVHSSWRAIGTRGADWGLVGGLPVATAGRIIADLARARVDDAEQGAVIADAVKFRVITVDEAAARLQPFAARWNEQDGLALAQRFTTAAGRTLTRQPR